MLITSRVEASAQVDEYHARQATPAEYEAALRRQLTAAVVHEGESIGASIRPQSVTFDVLPSQAMPWVTTVRALWNPNPAAGCEFHGGPADGAVIALSPVNGVAHAGGGCRCSVTRCVWTCAAITSMRHRRSRCTRRCTGERASTPSRTGGCTSSTSCGGGPLRRCG